MNNAKKFKKLKSFKFKSKQEKGYMMSDKKFEYALTLIAMSLGFGAGFVANFIWWAMENHAQFPNWLILVVSSVITFVVLFIFAKNYILWKSMK